MSYGANRADRIEGDYRHLYSDILQARDTTAPVYRMIDPPPQGASSEGFGKDVMLALKLGTSWRLYLRIKTSTARHWMQT